MFGLGGSGLASARALAAGGADVLAYDDDAQSVAKAQAVGIAVTDLRGIDWSNVSALVLAPGIPLTHPVPHWTVELAQKAGVEVIGDIELFCRERRRRAPDAPFVAITGTNGKSTTTALVAHLAASAGMDAQLGGNIGTAILSLAPPSADRVPPLRVHVIECSSYQIDLAPSLDPSIGILINLSEDHLDRHGTMGHYADVKERLVAGVPERGTAIVGVDDEWCLENCRSAGAVRQGSAANFRATCPDQGILRRAAADHARGRWEDFFNCRDRRDRFAARAAQCAERRLRRSGCACARAFAGGDPGGALLIPRSGAPHGGSWPARRGAFRQRLQGDKRRFRPLRRLPALTTSSGSPAANRRPAVSNRSRAFFPRIRRAYLIGEAAEEFAATLGASVPHEITGTLDKALAAAMRDAEKSTAVEPVVLLSPACASFDQYRNFEIRGDAFRALVRGLPGMT